MAMFEIIVGNVGKVHECDSIGEANHYFDKYVALSKVGRGRAGNENVDMYRDVEIIDEYIPLASLYEGGKCPDCGQEIPSDAEDGTNCVNCEHVFSYKVKTDD